MLRAVNKLHVQLLMPSLLLYSNVAAVVLAVFVVVVVVKAMIGRDRLNEDQ